MCRSDSSAFDTQQWSPFMFQTRILHWFWFWSQSQKKNTIRQVLLLLICLFICRFSSIGKSEYNHVYVFTNTFCAIVSLKINYIWPNILFSKYHQFIKTTHTCFVKDIFATGARLKQSVYVCIGQRFGWEIYLPLLSELNRFWPSPF